MSSPFADYLAAVEQTLRGAPHHKHIGESEVTAANAPDLQSVLKEIEDVIGA